MASVIQASEPVELQGYDELISREIVIKKENAGLLKTKQDLEIELQHPQMDEQTKVEYLAAVKDLDAKISANKLAIVSLSASIEKMEDEHENEYNELFDSRNEDFSPYSGKSTDDELNYEAEEEWTIGHGNYDEGYETE
jgi:hypothetical protein